MKKHLLLMKVTAILLSIVLVLVDLPMVLSAEDKPLEWETIPDSSMRALLLDFEETYKDSSDKTYYGDCDGTEANSSALANWSGNVNWRGSHTEAVEESGGNHAVRLTYDDENSENYNANPALNIYNPATKSKFVGTEGVTYTISFDYKVEETDGQNLQLFVAPSNREYQYPTTGWWGYAFASTDMGPKAVIPDRETPFTEASGVITETTEGWVRTSVEYTATASVNGHTVYPIILLQTNDKTKVENHTGAYASVLIDNIEISLSASHKLDFEGNYLDSNGKTYYGDCDGTEANSSALANWSGNVNWRGSHTEAVEESGGNHAVRLTYDDENSENYNANPALNIYNPATKSKFVGTEGVTYTISFDYKVEETDGQNLQLFVAPSNREYQYPTTGWWGYAFASTDMGPKAVIPDRETPFTEASGVITETTEGWVRTSVEYTATASVNGHTVYPIILLQTNDKTKVENHTGAYASVLIDNIKIEPPKRALITCYNYDGSDKAFYIYEDTLFADLNIPSRKGWIFEGWYTDSAYTCKAQDNELVGNYSAIYAKWSGNGDAMTPYKITDSFEADIKNVGYWLLSRSVLNQISYVQNSMIDVAGSVAERDFYGSYVFSSENTVTNSNEKFVIDNINVTSPASNTVMFYVELPDFEKSGADWGLALGDQGICIEQNSKEIWTSISGETRFDYCLNNKWVESTLSSEGVFTGLPSGYKGYIRIDFSALPYQESVDFTSGYVFKHLEFKFNALGGENGNAVLGGLLYFPKTKSESTVMKVNGLYYELSKSTDAIAVNAYDVKSETGSSFSTRYTGTVGQAAVKYADSTETSAFWNDNPAVITTQSGNAETTTGYMTTYINNKADILMQPGVDTIMFYVEMPVFEQNNANAGLKLLDSEIKQGDKTATLSFANSLYEYADVKDASWKIARAGADGDLFDISSGFKGYIKFDIKQFKNIGDLKANIDFSDLYYITKFELGFNHIGGENGNLVIGGVYSVIDDSNAPFLKNGVNQDKRCFKVIAGDFDCDGTYENDDMVLIRKTLVGAERVLDASAKLRENGIDIRTLVRAIKVKAGVAKTDTSVDIDNGAFYKEIFTADTVSNNTPTVYEAVSVTDYAAKIEADTSLNSSEKAVAFANEINNNKIGDFEKIGIDKMCHVSTFLYANNNIYVSYYANTISAVENPQYQVARFAYAPENDTDKKVILDIMQVGDDLYGHSVKGVYDTILMQKEDEPDNIYILWTANINGKYYRLYRIFNMKTEELGEIGVNRFKVGDVTNDFSSTGITNALTANNIGYKKFFSDIGIMQKLSTRVENGETYYYTGAYSGNFTCIIKSKDLITWEYVAQPNEGANGTGFENATKWENAVYVLGDKVYYFVRQWDPTSANQEGLTVGTEYGILTCYDLNTKEWAKPVLVGDCQSRSDFIYYKGGLYLFYAPTDRQHIGILKINTEDIAQTKVVLQADMNGSCFYPFVQYNSKGELCMSYTVSREHIRLASFTLSNYIE